MFQTEPILYLQSLASDVLTFFMLTITQMGYDPFLIGLTIFVTLGVSFRKGFLLLQLILWTGVIADVLELKELFGLPRPIHVDSRVLWLNSGIANESPFVGMGAKGFFEFLPREVVEYSRARLEGVDFGFPSGHVRTTTVLWGGMSLLFRNRAMRWIAPLMIVLMALSRMYLGRHFLADVIGGAAVGGVILLVAQLLYVRCSLQDRFFKRASLALSAKLPNILVFSFMFVVPLLLALTSAIDGDTAGYLLGVNAAFLLVMKKGLPDDSGTLSKRAARVVLGFLVFFVAQLAIDIGCDLVGLDDDVMEWVGPVGAAIPSFIALWGTVTICFRLGLYKESAVTRSLSHERA